MIDGERFFDLSRPRGSDAGPLLIQLHTVYRVSRESDTLTAGALDCGRVPGTMNGKRLGRVSAAMDDRRNVAVAAHTENLRAWLARKAPPDAFAAPTAFSRTNAQ